MSGSSFALNSAVLADGTHTLTLQVTNTGGLTASSTVVITTSNHQGLLVVAVGPGAIPLAGISVSVKGASGSLNSTTDLNGDAIFKNLNAGTYIASMVVNGTYISMPVNFQGNATVTLYAQNMVTTASAELQSGGSVPIEISGNVSASQLSGLFLN